MNWSLKPDNWSYKHFFRMKLLFLTRTHDLKKKVNNYPNPNPNFRQLNCINNVRPGNVKNGLKYLLIDNREFWTMSNWTY